MSESFWMVAVITVSDRSYQGQREDASGPAIENFLNRYGYRVTDRGIVPDEQAIIEDKLIELCDRNIPLIFTTGGTGMGIRDITPEATRKVIEREVPGLAEEMRRSGLVHTRFSMLSRSVAGIRGSSLIINLPGSPKGAIESIESILDVLPHALNLLVDKDPSHNPMPGGMGC